MPRQKTQAEAAIEARLRELDPNSDRYQVLHKARQFKSSWIDLAQSLIHVRHEESYKAWQYRSFEEYCRKELHIRAETADKLTKGYGFLQEYAPGELQEFHHGANTIPPLDVVALLSRGKEQTRVTPEQWESVRSDVFSPEKQMSRNAVIKRFRQYDPEAFAQAKPSPVTEQAQVTLPATHWRKALLLAERLVALMQEESAAFQQSLSSMEHVISELKARADIPETTQKVA